jgi:hypothetical protein
MQRTTRVLGSVPVYPIKAELKCKYIASPFSDIITHLCHLQRLVVFKQLLLLDQLELVLSNL